MNNNENILIQLNNKKYLGFAEYGDPKGKPVFIFHGWPGSRLYARFLDKSAKKLKVRLISPDRPGYGISDYESTRTLLDWPNTISHLANTLNIKKFSCIGVSGGAPYAAACAYKIPERLTSVGIVVGLAPTNIEGVLQGMGFQNKMLWRYYHMFPILIDISSSIASLLTRKFLAISIKFVFGSHQDQKILSNTNIKQNIMASRKEAFRQGKKGTAKDLELYTTPWGFNLEKIKAKVLLWYGDTDKNVSVNMGKFYASKIPRSHLTIYPNEGHLLFFNHKEEILKNFA